MIKKGQSSHRIRLTEVSEHKSERGALAHTSIMAGGRFTKWWSKRRRGDRRRSGSTSKSAGASRATTTDADTCSTGTATPGNNKNMRREGVEMLRRATMVLSIGAGDAAADDAASTSTSRSRRRSRVGCIKWGGSVGGGLGGLMSGWRGKSGRSTYHESVTTELPKEVGDNSAYDGASEWGWSTVSDRTNVPPASEARTSQVSIIDQQYDQFHDCESEVRNDKQTVIVPEQPAEEPQPIDVENTSAPSVVIQAEAEYTTHSTLDKDSAVNAENTSSTENPTSIAGIVPADYEIISKSDPKYEKEVDPESHDRLKRMCLIQFVQSELLLEYVSQLQRQCKILTRMKRKLEARAMDVNYLRQRGDALAEENELMKQILAQRESISGAAHTHNIIPEELMEIDKRDDSNTVRKDDRSQLNKNLVL